MIQTVNELKSDHEELQELLKQKDSEIQNMTVNHTAELREQQNKTQLELSKQISCIDQLT